MSRLRSRPRVAAILAAVVLATALPSSALGAHSFDTAVGSYVNLVVPGTIDPIITVGETYHGTLFEGIPDGIGVVPIGTINPGVSGAVDLYVNHEQSRVPFDPAGPEPNAADISDSSVTRWRIDIATKTIVDAGVAISDDEGFIRFCSSFMAGPQHGFANYTLLTNEESNDNLAVPAGAVYGSDPSMAPLREAGYAVAYDTATGQLTAVSRMGRMNHENATVVPGGWNKLAILTGDDTFTAPSSQLYLYTANDSGQVLADKGQLWAFQATAVDGAPVDGYDAFNSANDFLDISGTESFSGRFIHVPSDIARGVTDAEPQAGLEAWSNANNVFQFIRVEDIAYDPDNPRIVYFTDTGTAVQASAATTGPTAGRMVSGGAAQRGRVFKMVLNADDPRIVDSLTILADGNSGSSPFNRPDNIDVGHNSIMVQEDTGNARIWRYSLDAATPAWTHVATANQPTAETSGIVDASAWFGPGYWFIDVQSHWQAGAVSNWQEEHPPTADRPYWLKREGGQLLLMKIDGS